MSFGKPVQLENLKKLGVDPKRINGVYSGISACFEGLEFLEQQIMGKLGTARGEVSETHPDHPSIRRIQEVHKKLKDLQSMFKACSNLLELIQENEIDPANLGELKTKPEFLAMEKAWKKVPAGGPPDIEVLVKQVNELMANGLPIRGLKQKSAAQVDRVKNFFSNDKKLAGLVANIGGPGTLDFVCQAMSKVIENVRTPANPLINPAGTNLKPGNNTPD